LCIDLRGDENKLSVQTKLISARTFRVGDVSLICIGSGWLKIIGQSNSSRFN